MTQSTLSSQITQENTQGIIHQKKVTMRTPRTCHNHSMRTLRLALTQSTSMQDINTGSPGTLEINNPSDIEQESILTSQQATLIPQHADSGFVDITQGN